MHVNVEKLDYSFPISEKCFFFFFLRRQTVELVRRAEQCGVAWITVHGRTPKQRAEPASMEAIKLVSSNEREREREREQLSTCAHIYKKQ